MLPAATVDPMAQSPARAVTEGGSDGRRYGAGTRGKQSC